MQAAIETKLEELSEIRHKTTNVLFGKTLAGCVTVIAWAILMTTQALAVDIALTSMLVGAWLFHVVLLRRMSPLWKRGDQLIVELDADMHPTGRRDVWHDLVPTFEAERFRLKTTIYVFAAPLSIKLCMWAVRCYASIAVT